MRQLHCYSSLLNREKEISNALFVFYAKSVVSKKASEFPFIGISDSAKLRIVDNLYNEGKHVLRKINIDYKSFKRYVLEGPPSDYYNLAGECRYRYYSRFLTILRNRSYFVDNNYRVRSKFIKNRSNLKDSRGNSDGNSKKSWREYKKVRKDKAKAYYRRTGCPKHWKRYFNKKHRQWERENISKEDWQALSDRKKLKYISDPWHYD